ncbi:MAG: TetR family transcriptional regulator [Verrucomicrobiaceae bacterium]|nr:TetR family transcriptional regulator [Verrucomicrobiaceae bacterium]
MSNKPQAPADAETVLLKDGIAPKRAERGEKEGMQRIIEAAKLEFCKAGLTGAKLENIAQRAGVSKQLIHHYYRTKPGLYVAVANEISAQAIDDLSQLRYEEFEPADALRQFLYGVFDLYVRFPFMSGMVVDANLLGGEHFPECRELILRSPILMERLVHVIERGQQSGLFKQPLNISATFSAAIMVTTGCFTNGSSVSVLAAFDFNDQDNLKFWREYSVGFVLDALRP